MEREKQNRVYRPFSSYHVNYSWFVCLDILAIVEYIVIFSSDFLGTKLTAYNLTKDIFDKKINSDKANTLECRFPLFLPPSTACKISRRPKLHHAGNEGESKSTPGMDILGLFASRMPLQACNRRCSRLASFPALYYF